MKTSELSPLAETIEVSEDLILASGTLATDRNLSDMSNTNSEYKNGKIEKTFMISEYIVSQYLKSDMSISHSVLDVEYNDQTPKETKNPPMFFKFKAQSDEAYNMQI